MTSANVFGSNPVRSSYPQYLALTVDAQTSLVWPLETAGGQPYVAAQMDITPTVADVLVVMPSAVEGSTGIASIITNVGGVDLAIADANGTLIATITPSQSWIISLIDNTTIGGTWRAYQLAATTSNADAASLADNKTIQANGTKLQVFVPGQEFSANTTLGEAARGRLSVWTSANAGVFAIDAAANLTAGWFCFVSNEGAGAVTLEPSDLLINGEASYVLQQGSGVMVEYDGSALHTIGGILTPVSIANGGTGANNAEQALVNLGGSTIGISIFEAASAAAVLALLGLSGTIAPFTESTVNANQTLNVNSTQTAYVATQAISLTLPKTATLSTKFIFAVYAQGGIVTLIPDPADAINAGSAGANYQIAQGLSAMFMTDANGNWWPFFITSGGGAVSSVALTAPAEFVVTGSPGTGNVALVLAKANQAPNTFYAGPASGGSGQPLFRAITLADIASIIPSTGVTSVFGRGGAVVAVTDDYTVDQVTGAAPLASPSFTGNPQAPTPMTTDDSTAIATTDFVKSQAYAPLASPAFTGTPTAPTPGGSDNSTKLATTAWVQGQDYLTAIPAFHAVGSLATATGTAVGGTLGAVVSGATIEDESGVTLPGVWQYLGQIGVFTTGPAAGDNAGLFLRLG